MGIIKFPYQRVVLEFNKMMSIKGLEKSLAHKKVINIE